MLLEGHDEDYAVEEHVVNGELETLVATLKAAAGVSRQLPSLQTVAHPCDSMNLSAKNWA
jgi:hypothetical protein